MITYIVAARYSQAQNYARENKMEKWSWRYVNEPYQLMGIENPAVIFLPGWTSLNNAERIAEEVQIRTIGRTK